MGERKISVDQVYEAVIHGQIVEKQHSPNYPDIHIIFQAITIPMPSYYIIVAVSQPNPIVVTVCNTKDESWEYINGLLKRRR